MLFTTETVKTEQVNEIANFFEQYDTEVKVVDADEVQEVSQVAKYISSLVCNQYAQAVEDIANTKVGNRLIRKRSLQQIMRESFFNGANRFGNNFIA